MRMKYIFIFLFILMTTPTWAESTPEALANHVYGDYWKQVFLNKHSQRAEVWIRHHPAYFSDSFIRAMNVAVNKANKVDPIMGIDHDIMVCGQDGPDRGYHATKAERRDNAWRVTLQADEPGWETLMIDIIQVGDTFKIDDICEQRKKKFS